MNLSQIKEKLLGHLTTSTSACSLLEATRTLTLIAVRLDRQKKKKKKHTHNLKVVLAVWHEKGVYMDKNIMWWRSVML